MHGLILIIPKPCATTHPQHVEHLSIFSPNIIGILGQVPGLEEPSTILRATQPRLVTVPTLTWEMVELVRMGLMCSVARSAQADMQRVESRRMTSARQRDQ